MRNIDFNPMISLMMKFALAILLGTVIGIVIHG